MDFALIDPFVNFVALSCGFGLVIVAVLGVFLALTRILVRTGWWVGQDD